VAEASLERAFLTCNKNAIPFDPEKPAIASGLRVGSPAATTRGFGTAEFIKVGELMVEVLDGLVAHPKDNSAIEQSVREQVQTLCADFPIYQTLE